MYTIQTAKSGKVYGKVSDAIHARLMACDAHYVSGEAIVILAHRQGTETEYGRIDPINERSSRWHRQGKRPRLIDATGQLTILRADALPD